MVMNNWLKNALEKISKASKAAQETFQALFSNEFISIFDLASFIRSHPDTVHQTKQYVGLTFHFYQLKAGDLMFYLETKGDKEEYVLSLKIYAQNEKLLDFQSYTNDTSLYTPVPVPKEVTNTVTVGD
jgi:hypothetical protein